MKPTFTRIATRLDKITPHITGMITLLCTAALLTISTSWGADCPIPQEGDLVLRREAETEPGLVAVGPLVPGEEAVLAVGNHDDAAGRDRELVQEPPAVELGVGDHEVGGVVDAPVDRVLEGNPLVRRDDVGRRHEGHPRPPQQREVDGGGRVRAVEVDDVRPLAPGDGRHGEGVSHRLDPSRPGEERPGKGPSPRAREPADPLHETDALGPGPVRLHPGVPEPALNRSHSFFDRCRDRDGDEGAHPAAIRSARRRS